MTKANATSSNVGGGGITKTIKKRGKGAGASKDAGSSKQKEARTKALVKQLGRDAAGKGYIYIRSNPKKFSIQDLLKEPNSTVSWDKFRDAAGRHFIRQVKVGDLALFYHSNTKSSGVGVVGTVEIVKMTDNAGQAVASADRDTVIPQSNTFSKTVDIKLGTVFQKCITRDELKNFPLKNSEIITNIHDSMGPVHPDDFAHVNMQNVKEENKKKKGDMQKDDKEVVDKDEKKVAEANGNVDEKLVVSDEEKKDKVKDGMD